MGATRVVTSTSPHHMPENNRYVKQATKLGLHGARGTNGLHGAKEL
jgi:hypothetical protein